MERLIGRLHCSLYRATGGKIGGNLAGRPILLLTTTGRRSGVPRTVPVVYRRVGDSFVVVASNNGKPASPGWFHNLAASPDAEILVGRNRVSVRARVTEGGERDRLFGETAARWSNFRRYQEKTSRTIPVVVLEPRT